MKLLVSGATATLRRYLPHPPALLSPQLALASGIAFFVSELADFAVYTPLADRSWGLALLLSNTVGACCDSAIFLFLAFGSLQYMEGQVLGKLWMTLLTFGFLFLWRTWAHRAYPLKGWS